MNATSSTFDRSLNAALGRPLAMGLAAVLGALLAVPLAAQVGGDPTAIRVYAYTLEHRATRDVVDLVRPLLSFQGTVEEQPGTSTLVIRDSWTVISTHIVPLLRNLDRPPRDLRFDIRVLRAASRSEGTQPAPGAGETAVSESVVRKLRGLLRYDEYHVLAQAGVSAKEGEPVTYALGDTYTVSFHPGAVLAGQRLRLDGFRIDKVGPASAIKGRRLEPRRLFNATLNLYLERPLTLVLARDTVGQEALVVAITFRMEGDEDAPPAKPARSQPPADRRPQP